MRSGKGTKEKGKTLQPGIEREKCLRERDIFRHGGKIPAMGMGKRPENFRYGGKSPSGGEKTSFGSWKLLLLRFCINVGGK